MAPDSVRGLGARTAQLEMDRCTPLSRSRAVTVLSGFLLVAYSLFPNARLDFTRFNAHDAESYIALSRSMVEGRGYTRSLDADVYVPHLTWPPGLPLLLVPGVWLAGMPAKLLPIKATIIAIGVAGLLIAAEYARRVARSDLAGVFVLILLGTNPFYWNFSRMAMTEVPAFAWAALSLLLIHRAWSAGPPRLASSLAVGIAAGFGMLLRGTLIGLALAPIAFVFAQRPEGARLNASSLRAYVVFAAGFAVCFVAWSLRNAQIDTSGLGFDGIDQGRMLLATSPIDPAAPLRSVSQILVDVVHAFTWHVIYHIPQQSIPGAWLPAIWSRLGAWEAPAALVLTIAVVLGALRSRAVLPVLLSILPGAVLCAVLVQGGGARYWMNVSFWLIVAASIRLGPPIERWALGRRSLFISGIALGSLLSLAVYVRQHERSPYVDAESESLARLYERIARERRDLPSVLAPHPHAFRIVTGQSAPMFIAGRGIDPEITHVVTRTEQWRSSCLAGIPVLSVRPWLLIQLETRERYSNVQRALEAPCPRGHGGAAPQRPLT
jgi:hypothetical protein